VVDQAITLGSPVGNGSARIISTSKKVACGAIVADKTSNPPVSMTTLRILSKLKQKGD